MQNSNIQWTDHTWNIAVGCSKVDADCKFCYMFRESLKETRYKPTVVRKTTSVFRLPLKIKEPSKIFTSSLTDVFHPDCDAFRNEMWDIIRQCPQHTFQILTKRPERIVDNLPADWGEGWANVWLGTSVGSQKGADRILDLWHVPAKIRFLSLEPLHGKFDLGCIDDFLYNGKPAFHWIIVGGESGNETGKYRYRACKLDWIEKIVKDCQNAEIPVFVKQLGTHLAKELSLKDRHGGNIDEWPEYLKVREFPNLKSQ